MGSISGLHGYFFSLTFSIIGVDDFVGEQKIRQPDEMSFSLF